MIHVKLNKSFDEENLERKQGVIRFIEDFKNDPAIKHMRVNGNIAFKIEEGDLIGRKVLRDYLIENKLEDREAVYSHLVKKLSESFKWYKSEDPQIPEILAEIGDIHSASLKDISDVVERHAGGLTPRYRNLMNHFKGLKNGDFEESKRPLSIMRQFKKGFEALDKAFATIPSVQKALTEFRFKVGSEDFNGDYVITVGFDKEIIDIQNVYWYLNGQKDKVKMTSKWNKEKAAAVLINDALEYDDAYLMDSPTETLLYITNATPTNEYMQESKKARKSLRESFDDEDDVVEYDDDFEFSDKDLQKELRFVKSKVGTWFNRADDVTDYIYDRKNQGKLPILEYLFLNHEGKYYQLVRPLFRKTESRIPGCKKLGANEKYEFYVCDNFEALERLRDSNPHNKDLREVFNHFGTAQDFEDYKDNLTEVVILWVDGDGEIGIDLYDDDQYDKGWHFGYGKGKVPRNIIQKALKSVFEGFYESKKTTKRRFVEAATRKSFVWADYSELYDTDKMADIENALTDRFGDFNFIVDREGDGKIVLYADKSIDDESWLKAKSVFKAAYITKKKIC